MGRLPYTSAGIQVFYIKVNVNYWFFFIFLKNKTKNTSLGLVVGTNSLYLCYTV